MYTEKALCDTKYGELLKIAKTLGIKGARQKTEKLIQSILNAQKDISISEKEELLEDIQFPDDSFSSCSSSVVKDLSFKDEEVNTTSANGRKCKKGGKKRGRSNTYVVETDLKDSPTDKTVSPKRKKVLKQENIVSKSNGKKEKRVRSKTFSPEESETNKSLKRSGTFCKDDQKSSPQKEKTEILPERQNENKPKDLEISEKLLMPSPSKKPLMPSPSKKPLIPSPSKKPLMPSPSKKRKRSSESSDSSSHQTRKKRSSIIPTMGQPAPVLELDLSCNEIQTAQDIQYIEETSFSENSFVSVPKTRSVVRRSLRGQLLESRLSVHERLSIVKQNESPSHCSMAKDEVIQEDPSPSDSKEISLENKPQFTIGKSPRGSDGNATSIIPRFVSYARKIKQSRMPNFAKIHQKAFNKMEALDEYVDRKRLKTPAPSSVTKMARSGQSSAFKPSVMSTTKMKINFTETKTPVSFSSRKSATSTVNRISSVRKSVGNTVEKENNRLKRATTTSSQKPLKRLQATTSKISKPKIDSGLRKTSPLVANKENIKKPSALPRPIKEMKNISTSSPAWNKNVKDPIATPGSFQRRKSYNPKFVSEDTSDSGILKPVIKTASNREAIKNLAQKNPNIKSRTERKTAQKVYIKGVRTNKRFELQMANRLK